MPDFETHHVAPQGLRSLLQALHVDVDAAINTLDLPLSSFENLPTHGLQGNHLRVGYTSGVRQGRVTHTLFRPLVRENKQCTLVRGGRCMPRIARVVAPNTPHHVTQRGNRRQITFFRDADYVRYLQLAAEWCAKVSAGLPSRKLQS